MMPMRLLNDKVDKESDTNDEVSSPSGQPEQSLALTVTNQQHETWYAVSDLVPRTKSEESLVNQDNYYNYFSYIPRNLFFIMGYGRDAVVTVTASGAVRIGKYSLVKSANYGLKYVRDYIQQTNFEDEAAKQQLLEIFDANIVNTVNGGALELDLFVNLPYAIPTKGYQAVARLLFANLPIAAINYTASWISWLSAAVTAYNYVTGQNEETYVSNNLQYMLLPALLKYLECFPPAFLSVPKELTLNEIKSLWQKTFIFNTMMKKCSKNNLAPQLSDLLDNILKIYSENTPPPKYCVLNSYNDFVENNRLVILDVNLVTDTVESIQTRTENNRKTLNLIREEYVKSLALEIFAKNEAKRLYSLIKSLGTKLSAGSPGSPESLALDVMLVSLANMIGVGVEGYILTEGNTAISASEKINNARQIAQTFGIDLKPPSYMELCYASLWLKRPDVSIALDQVVNSFAPTAPIFTLATRVRDEINGATVVSCKNLTWGYSRLKKAVCDNKYMLAAAVPLIPIACTMINEYNNQEFRPTM